MSLKLGITGLLISLLGLTACGGAGEESKSSTSSQTTSSLSSAASSQELSSLISSSSSAVVTSSLVAISSMTSSSVVSSVASSTTNSVVSSQPVSSSQSSRTRSSRRSSSISSLGLSSSIASSITSSLSSSAVSNSSSSRSSSSSGSTEVLAFPGAEGFAAKVTGGRGGRVIKVTTLNATGPGSLSEALEASGKRIIVFDVSGVIKVGNQGGGILYIGNGDVTIAGQTAPGAGITIHGRLYTAGDVNHETGEVRTYIENMIIRHLRIRPTYDGSNADHFDAIQVYGGRNIIFDHVSASFGVDENFDIFNARDITVQWSTIESADKNSAHSDGDTHNYGLLNGRYGQQVSVINNLFANNRNRNPAISNGPADIVNNVIYNVRHGFHHNDASNGGEFNVAGNYYKRGPSSEIIPIWFFTENGEINRSYFVNDWVDRGGSSSTCNEGALTNPFTQCDNNSSSEFNKASLSNTKFNFTNVTGWKAPVITSPQETYANVLAKAGAFPRDVVTKRSVTETQNRTGAWDARNENLNLMEGLTAGTAPTDTDGDGMPDSWETARGLNPNVKDNNKIMPSGYDAIEEYINELADELIK